MAKWSKVQIQGRQIQAGRPSSVSATAVNQIPQQSTLDELDDLASVNEIMKATHQMNSNWALGKGGILAKLYKAVGQEAIDIFHDILSHMWEQEKMSEDFPDALIVDLYKNKGSISSLPCQKPIYQMPSVDFAQGTAQLTWFSQRDRSKRNA